MADLFVKDGENFVPYSGAKLIPESDLIAAKGGLESKVTQLTTELAEAKTASDGNYTRALKAESDAEALKVQITPLQTEAAKVAALTTQLAEATRGRTDLESKVLTSLRTDLARKYNIQGDKLKELDAMDASRLTQLDKDLATFGVPAKGNSFDTGAGGSGSDPWSRSPRDNIKAGLAAGNAERGTGS